MTGESASIPRRQTVLAYALLFTVLACAWVLLVQPALSAYHEVRTAAQALRMEIEGMRRTMETDPALDPALAMRRIKTLKTYIDQTEWHAPTVDIAGSRLQRRLAEAIEGHGGEVRDTTIMRDSDPSTVSVSVHFNIALSGLKEVLYDLSAAEPYIFVDLLSIQTPDRYINPVAAGGHWLAIQIDAATFWNAKGS